MVGAPGETRTPGLLVRSQSLYPAELRARFDTIILVSGHCGLNRETEIKLRAPEPAAARALLASRGFTESRPRLLERNCLYDDQGATLQAEGRLLRIREQGGEAIFTYKGPSETTGGHKSREEIEAGIGGAANFALILERLGYRPGFRYEKYRTEFTDGAGIVTLDETPVGEYFEIEGESAWIDRTAALLGYTPDAYITLSYYKLYLEHCEQRGVEPGDLLF